jgi:hypothetical protein
MHFPQPRFVHTWLFALSRLQCGQIVFGNGTTFSVSEKIMPPYGSKRNTREAKSVLVWRASCTGSSTLPDVPALFVGRLSSARIDPHLAFD